MRKAELIPIRRNYYGRGSFKIYRMTGDVKKSIEDFFELRPKNVQYTKVRIHCLIINKSKKDCLWKQKKKKKKKKKKHTHTQKSRKSETQFD